MGFNGGKKKKAGAESDTGSTDHSASQRRSRRVVTPGGRAVGGGAGAVAKAPAPAARPAGRPPGGAQVGDGISVKTPQRPAVVAPTEQRPAATRPGTSRTAIKPANNPASSGIRPAGGGGPRPSGPKPQVRPEASSSPESLMLAAPEPSTIEEVSSPRIQTPARPKSKDPILGSKPLDFGGDLARAAPRSGPVRSGDKALLDFLKDPEKGLINAEQADQVRETSMKGGLPLDVTAVKAGLFSEEQLVDALTKVCWVPHLKVDKYEIRKKALDTISREDALYYGVFPVDKLGGILTLAMVNPLDVETIRVLESKISLDIKKVVATRSEITQGIEKYYSGQVQAVDSSLAFTQDIEPKSVTQMLSRVTVAAADSPVDTLTQGLAEPNIVPEIEDIDELLSSDEIISPAIIEPMAIKAGEPASLSAAELEPLSIKPILEPDSMTVGVRDEIDEIAIAPPTSALRQGTGKSKVSPPAKAPASDMLDLDVDISIPGSAPAAGKGPDLVPGRPPGTPSGAPKTGAPAPVTRSHEALERHGSKSGPSAPAQAPSPTRADAPPIARAAPPPVAPVHAPAAPAKTGTRSFTSGTRPETRRVQAAQPGVVNLVPVMEEEFQHAITHGKAHVFEKWVGLQSRNRIINGVPIVDEQADLLSMLFQARKR